MTEPFDLMQPWTIKSVPVRTSDAIKKAARQEGITVGQWLERRVSEWIGAGSPVRVEPQRAEVQTASRISDVVMLAEATAKLATLPDDQAMVKTARIMVRRSMLALGRTEAPTGSSMVVVPTHAQAAVAHANGN